MDEDAHSSDSDASVHYNTVSRLARPMELRLGFADGFSTLKRGFPFPPKPRDNAGDLLKQLRSEGIIGEATLNFGFPCDGMGLGLGLPPVKSTEMVSRKYPRYLNTLPSPRDREGMVLGHRPPAGKPHTPEAMYGKLSSDVDNRKSPQVKKGDSFHNQEDLRQPVKRQRTDRLRRPNTPNRKKTRHKSKRPL